jgi:hypothetical protein
MKYGLRHGWGKEVDFIDLEKMRDYVKKQTILGNVPFVTGVEYHQSDPGIRFSIRDGIDKKLAHLAIKKISSKKHWILGIYKSFPK